jgi:tetratricopeptide (TPR) repeat protein
MRSLVCVLAALFVSLSCSRDPKVVARKYIESGNRYFAAGKYKEASLMYRNALQKQPKSGEAYYRMALTAMKLGDAQTAIASLMRAVEPDSGLTGSALVDAKLKQSELLMQYNPAQGLPITKKHYEAFLQADPNSYEGHRLKATWLIRDMVMRGFSMKATPPDAKEVVQQALEEYRRALRARPFDPDVTLAIVPLLKGQNQSAEAVQLLEGLIGKGKGTPAAYQQLADLYYGAQKPAESEKILKQGIDRFLGDSVRASADPAAYQLLVMLAEYYRTQKRRDEMVKTIDQLKSYGSKYPEAYSRAAGFYAKINEPDMALRQYDEGIQALPKQKLAYQKEKMFFLATQRKNAEAARVADEILKEHPKDEEATTLRSSLNLGKEGTEKAIKDLEGVVGQSPKNWLARYNLGRAYLMKGDIEAARRQFVAALNERPNHAGSLIGLGQIQVAQKEFKPALDNAQRILSMDKNSLPAHLISSAARIGMGQVKEAKAELREVLDKYPTSAEAMVQMGLLARHEKNLKESETWFRKAFDTNPANINSLRALVETIGAQNQPARALEVLRTEAQKYPNRVEIREMLGNYLVRTGKLDAGAAEFKAAAESQLATNKAAAVSLYLKMGEIQRIKGDHAGAIQTGEKARALDSRNFQALAFLALAYDGAGKPQEARRIYNEALKIDPNNVVVLNNYAYLLAQTGGSLDEALTYAQRAMQAKPEVDEIADTLGWIYLKKQLTDNAIEMFQRIVAKQPRNPVYQYHLALALDQKGNRDEARKHVEIALQNNPPQSDVESMRRLLQK